jgi:ribosomal protein L7/L12
MATSKDDILKAIEEMSVMDLVDLISAIEEKFGVTAAAVVAAAPCGLPRRGNHALSYCMSRERSQFLDPA